MVAITRNTPSKASAMKENAYRIPHTPVSISKLALKSPGILKTPGKRLALTPAKGIGTHRNLSTSKAAGYGNRRSARDKNTDHVSYQLQQKFDRSVYERYAKRAMADRKKRGAGQSQEMNTLYRFWSYYLREDTKNQSATMQMYGDFKDLALADAKMSYMYGMQCLFRYFSYGLEAKFDTRQWRDFQEAVMADVALGSFYVLEKLWAFLKFRDASAPWAPVGPEVRKLLKKHSTDDKFTATVVAAVTEHTVSGGVLQQVDPNVSRQPSSNDASFKTPGKTPSRQSKRNTLNPFASCFVPCSTQLDSPDAMMMSPMPVSFTPMKSAMKSFTPMRIGLSP